MKKIMDRHALVRGEADHELLQFFLGVLMLGGGIYWALNLFQVSWNWGYRLFGSWDMSAGVMLVPLLIGIFLLFLLDNKVIGGVISALGVVVIIISMITSIHFTATGHSAWVYVLAFGFIFAGGGLVAKVLFTKKGSKKDNSDDQFKL